MVIWEALVPWLAAVAIVAGACRTTTPVAAPEVDAEPAVPTEGHASPPPAADNSQTDEETAVVLARAPGKAGEIVVEERDGRRVLRIGEIVQGSTAKGDDIVVNDPLVELVRSMTRDRGRALLVGLGTGRTARQLAERRTLDVVEIEPKVIEFARTHFGFEGDVLEADGPEFIRKTTAAYEAIVFDAFDGTLPPGRLVDEAGLRAAVDRLLYAGVLAIRLMGEPDAAWVEAIRLGLAPLDVRIFGTGVGTERQNLYLLASRRRIQIDLALHRGVRQVYPAVGDAMADVQLVGYLVRDTSSGALVIDAAHDEMGAQRYVVEGRLAERLAAQLPKGAAFPVENDAPLGPAIRKVPRDLVGGEGVLRSDLRFSPVVVAVRGVATLLVNVHPNLTVRHQSARATMAAQMGQRPPKTLDPRLPKGGALYSLDVSEIRGVYTKPAWQRVRRGRLRKPLDLARSAARAGDLERTQAALGVYLKIFDEHFGEVARLLQARAGIADLVMLVGDGAASTGEPLRTAALCKRLARHTRGWRGDAARLTDPFVDCAIGSYQAAIGDDPRAHPKAARALIDLLADEADYVEFDDPDRAKRLRRTMLKLAKKSGKRVSMRRVDTGRWGFAGG